MRTLVMLVVLLATVAGAADNSTFNSFSKKGQKLGANPIDAKVLCICHGTRPLLGTVSTAQGLVNGEQVVDVTCNVLSYAPSGELVRAAACHPVVIPGATSWEVVK